MIPAEDVLAHTKGFASLYDTYRIEFDFTFRDHVRQLFLPELRDASGVAIDISDLKAGKALDIAARDDRFYITTPTWKRAAPLEVKGVRQFACLVRLVRTEAIREGSVLLWDEPDASLNPALVSRLARALGKLAGQGVPAIAATHYYILLRELEFESGNFPLQFIALEATAEGVTANPADSYAAIEPNPIIDEFNRIYNRHMTQSRGRLARSANGTRNSGHVPAAYTGRNTE